MSWLASLAQTRNQEEPKVASHVNSLLICLQKKMVLWEKKKKKKAYWNKIHIHAL